MSFVFTALLILQSVPATGSISGTVVLAGSTAQVPLVTARVELSGGPMSPRVVRTDGEGRFAFANLPPGSYRMRVTKDGFLRQEYAKGAAIIIKPGEAPRPVIFAMELAPTIAGRIQSEFGEPISNIQVQALKAVYGPDGKRTFTALASTLSDDRGEYRLYWLDPGDYIVSATFVPPVLIPGNPNEPLARVVYAPTYYPNASDLANAQRISLKADQNSLTNDFRLVRAPAVTVRGSTEKAGIGRAPSTFVTLTMAGDSTGAPRYAAKSDDLGSFEIKNVAPGSYIAIAVSTAGTERYTASKHIVIYDRDENNVGLILNPGVPITGRIAIETGAVPDLSGTLANLISTDPYLESFAAGFPSDGQFSVPHVQRGVYELDIIGIPQDLYIKSERSGQTNLLDTPLQIDWESPAPLEVLLGADGGHIEGTVTDSAGKPFAGAQLVLAPSAERRNRPDPYRTATSDEDGHFELRGIPPGGYRVFAWEDIEEHAWLNSEFMSKYLDMGTAVSITANSNETVRVQMIPGKQ